MLNEPAKAFGMGGDVGGTGAITSLYLLLMMVLELHMSPSGRWVGGERPTGWPAWPA